MSLDSFSTARTSSSTSTDADADPDDSPISPLEPRTWTLSPSILEDTQIARSRLTPPPSSAHSGAPSPTIPTHPPRSRQSQLLREPSTRSTTSPYDRASKPTKYEHAHPSRGQQRHHLFPPSSLPRTSATDTRGPSPAPSFSVVSCSPAPPSPSATSAQNLRSDEDPTPLHATLRWEISPSNPRNWPDRTKWLRAFFPGCAVAFTVAFGASIVAPGLQTFSDDRARGILPLSLYVLGLTFGPAVGGVGSAVFGRKLVFLLSAALFGIFTLAAGLLHKPSGILAFRFLAGLAASPILPASLSALADLWPGEGEKSVPLAVILAFTALGSTLGPAAGGVVVKEERWGWTQFVVLFALAGCVVPILAMQETERRAIRRREKRESMRGKVSVEEVREIILEPMRLLGRAKRVLLSSLVGGYYVGVGYAVYTVLPRALGDVKEGFGLDSQGYVFVGMSVGVLVGLIIFLGYETFVWRPRSRRYQEAHTTSTTATIPAIWDEKTPEEEKQRRRSKRLSFGPSHEQILMNSSGTPDRRGKRDSLLLSLRRMSFGNSYRNLDSEQQSPEDAHRNLLLAVVASRYLNGLEANSARRISPERMLLLWNQHQDFGSLCLALEGYGLQLQRVDFAKSLIDGLEGEDGNDHRPHSSSRVNAMAVAELEKKVLSPNSSAADAAAPFPVIRTAPPLSPSKATKRSKWSPPPHLPPPEWRLALALPSAIALPASLFILAWTTRAGIHWIVPVIGLFLFALSGFLALISMMFYVMDICGPAQSPAALATGVMVSCLAGFTFPLFAQPMVENLGIGWVLSVFAFVGVVVGVLPGIFWILGKKRREKELGGSRGWNMG